MSEPLWITEAEVTSILDMPAAVAALERGLLLEASGAANNMTKTHATWGNGDTLHAIGAVMPGRGLVGTKTWAHTEGGATPLLILYDAHNGALRAIIEAFALGQFRTGAMSAVGTKYQAAADADVLAIIGTGKQSLPQVAAVHAVRPLRRVNVYSPTPEHCRAFATKVQQTLGIEAVPAADVHAATRGARIVTLVTRATSPFLQSSDLEPGAHVNAVGAIVPSRVEFAQDLFARCGSVAADSPEAVQKLSREFIDYFGAGSRPWSDVAPIAQLVAARASRAASTDLSLFKAMGVGISDLALGMDILSAAGAQGIGRPIPTPTRAPLTFFKPYAVTR